MGTIIAWPEMRRQLLDNLKPDDFYTTENRLIFKTCLELDKKDKPIDLPTIKTALDNKKTDIKASYLSEMVNYLVAGKAEAYVEELRNKAVLRRGIETANAIMKACYQPDTAGKTVAADIQAVMRRIEEGLCTGYLSLDDPHESLSETLMEKHERDQNRDPDEPLGYELEKFKALAKNIDGVQPGFYVVGAETNAGKTAFLCNLTLDLLDSNLDVSGIYFSLDDNKDVILNRFLSINTGIPLNQVQRPQTSDKHKNMLQGGYSYLFNLADSERLFVKDASEIADIDDLRLEIKRRMSRKLFVIIDGLYNLDVGGTGADIRKENIERANELKSIADAYRIPVICTGELRKKERNAPADRAPSIDDLMETGKFAYNANLVLLLYPDKWEDYNTEDEPLLNLKYAKNKLSHVRTTETIKFIRKTSQVEEHKGKDVSLKG
jgi:replicative DNA helicase